MSTGSDLVYDALYACQAVGANEPISADDSALVLRRLNRLLDSWSNVRQLCYEITTDSFSTVAGTQQYATTLLTTMGRPISIDSMRVRQSGSDFPVEVITAEEWARINYKAARGMPDVCWYDTAYPTGLLNLYPTPDAIYTAYVAARLPLPAITLVTAISFPRGYEKAIVDGLAVDIAPSFGRPVTADMRVAADAAEYVLRTTNYEPGLLDPSYGTIPSRSNIFSGE